MASPEMIVALRSQSLWISNEMYHRSNIFTLGMILLEAATLRPSSLCYEQSSLDILDREVQDRLMMVEKFYPPMFRKILEKMLCYDYEQRMNPHQLSVFVYEIQKGDIFAQKELPLQSLTQPIRSDQQLWRSMVSTQSSPSPRYIQSSERQSNLNMSVIEESSPMKIVPHPARYSGITFPNPRH